MNLDGADSHQVRRFICGNALMWLRDYHIDGLRLDAVHAMIDTSAVHILEQLRCDVDQLESQSGRRLILIAENDLNDPRIVESRDIGGYDTDARWNDDFHHALHVTLAGENSGYYADFTDLPELSSVCSDAFQGEEWGASSPFLYFTDHEDP
jgi:maltooligosyltrehalose trehalohydrolase